jgi:hypothetical protein
LAGLSRHREQALDELALAGEDSTLRRHLRITSRPNWAKDRSRLSVSRPNTDKMGLFCPSGASLPDEFWCNSPHRCGRRRFVHHRLGCNLYLCELKAAFTASATVVMTTLSGP